MSSIGTKRTRYTAEFTFGVDEKRRVQIPAKWRPAEEDMEYNLVLWPRGGVPDFCLMGFPPQVMDALVDKMAAMPFADPKTESLRRLIGTKSHTVTMDKSGRITIPEVAAKAAGIDKEAVLLGLLDRFQIWSPDRYAAVKANDEASLIEAFNQI